MRTLAAAAILLLSLLPLLGSEAAAPDPLAGDSRLARKVLLHVEGLPVGDLLARLSEKTGIALGAGRDIAAEKVMVFGPARPLREQLADLAALLNTTWERKVPADGKPRYTLVRPVPAQQYEARLARAALDRMLARMEEQVRALEETPEQLARHPDGWIRQRLSDPRGRVGTRLYACLTPAQKEQVFTGPPVHVPNDALTAEQKQQLQGIFPDVISEREQIAERDRAEGFMTPLIKMEDLESSGLTFKLIHGDLVQVMVVFDRVPGAALVAALIDGRTRWPLPPHGDPYNGQPVPADASLPETKVAREAGVEKAWPDQLRRLAVGSGQPLLADYYRVPQVHREGYDPAAPPPGEAAAALDRLCLERGYLWWTRGKTLLVRKRDFYTHRLREVPDDWLLKTIDRLQARGGRPTYGDAGRLAELTPEQLVGLSALAPPESLSNEPDGAPRLRLFLGLLQIGPNAEATPVQVGPLTREARQRITIAYPALTRAQQRLLPLLLAADEHPVPPEQLPTFGGYLLCPDERMVEERNGYRFIRLILTWGFDKPPRAASYPNRTGISLPMSLPDDRRAHTRIELEPDPRTGT